MCVQGISVLCDRTVAPRMVTQEPIFLKNQCIVFQKCIWVKDARVRVQNGLVNFRDLLFLSTCIYMCMRTCPGVLRGQKRSLNLLGWNYRQFWADQCKVLLLETGDLRFSERAVSVLKHSAIFPASRTGELRCSRVHINHYRKCVLYHNQSLKSMIWLLQVHYQIRISTVIWRCCKMRLHSEFPRLCEEHDSYTPTTAAHPT